MAIFSGRRSSDRNALAALQADERTMVKDDIACEEKHLADTELEVRIEYEERIKEEHAALLERVPPV